jgi:hypothetical protein
MTNKPDLRRPADRLSATVLSRTERSDRERLVLHEMKQSALCQREGISTADRGGFRQFVPHTSSEIEAIRQTADGPWF